MNLTGATAEIFYVEETLKITPNVTGRQIQAAIEQIVADTIHPFSIAKTLAEEAVKRGFAYDFGLLIENRGRVDYRREGEVYEQFLEIDGKLVQDLLALARKHNRPEMFKQLLGLMDIKGPSADTDTLSSNFHNLIRESAEKGDVELAAAIMNQTNSSIFAYEVNRDMLTIAAENGRADFIRALNLIDLVSHEAILNGCPRSLDAAYSAVYHGGHDDLAWDILHASDQVRMEDDNTALPEFVRLVQDDEIPPAKEVANGLIDKPQLLAVAERFLGNRIKHVLLIDHALNPDHPSLQKAHALQNYMRGHLGLNPIQPEDRATSGNLPQPEKFADREQDGGNERIISGGR
ncbi:MAG: hypothetical protein COV36_04440 [Alphaproteobacteria bacterium CG11_big_fil_rev_8_21_14_0_20_44_7]|nr:MAG: hypothetical protein COV36_04440 [Alphaproteobacteria bacterium CG11_big_fil_rev_8_21_14_0_20_44_7]